MNNFNSKLFLGVVIVFLAIVSLFLLASVSQIVNTATTTNTVSFSGEGKVTAKPDIAVISFSIVTQATESKQAQDDNSKKSNAITDYLKQQGIADKDIKTSNYNVYPQYDYRIPQINGSPRISGYQVSQSFELKVRNLDKVSTLLDGLVKNGANQVSNLGFKIDNPEKLKSEARAKAIADAKSKADVLKNQLGISLGRIINFSENTGGYPMPVMYDAMTKGVGMGGGVAPSIPSGENEITVDVTITYQIK